MCQPSVSLDYGAAPYEPPALLPDIATTAPGVALTSIDVGADVTPRARCCAPWWLILALLAAYILTEGES
jgi:hypothetical protein